MNTTDAIQEALDDVERDLGVRILHACESGSRAWGFASPDSDYDVRFLYVRDVDWYLRLIPGKDTVDRMLPGDLDLVGWDLHKALRLFANTNPSLMEHLGSDIVYRDVDGFGARFAALIPEFFNPIGAAHHYIGLASKIRREYFPETGPVNLKKLFYVIRPLAACAWVRQHHTMPPTAFAPTLAGIELGEQQRSWIDDLLARKADASEQHDGVVAPEILGWLADWLLECRHAAKELPSRKGDMQRLDDLFLQAVRNHDS